MDETDDIDIDESYEPIRPKAAEPPPLPRMWKDPDGEPVESSPSAKKKKRAADLDAPADRPRAKAKRRDPYEDVDDDGTGAIKLEETPVLDTYETRQRVRILVGTIITVIGLTGLVLVLKAFKGSDSSRENEVAASPVTPELRATAEQEARLMLDMARKADENGRTSAALEQLNKLIKVYPGTAATREAMHAVERNRQNMPLFSEEIPVEALASKPAPRSVPTATVPSIARSAANNPNPNPAATTAPGPTPNASGPATGNATAPSVASTGGPNASSRPLPAGYRPKYEFPIHGSGWPTRIVCDRDGAEMVLIPAATFLMGRDDGDVEEGPSHPVFVSTFYIDLHEVTVRQYTRYLKESGRPVDAAKLGQDDLPMVGLTFRDAKAYCTWAKRRLPTEAQWELAARGPDLGRISYWNGELPRKDPARGPRLVEPVMSLSSDVSPYGVLDLAANAWEWTGDFYDSRYYLRSRGLVGDPTGPATSPARVVEVAVRGGSKQGLLTWRDGLKTETKLPYLGFRGALPVEGPPIAPPVAKPAPTGGPGAPGASGAGLPPM